MRCPPVTVEEIVLLMSFFLTAICVLVIFMTTVFALAMYLKDNSIVDVAYGLAFVLVCWAAYLGRGSGHPRQLLALGMTTVWGVRLAGHIFLRKGGEGEDFRYRKWREAWGRTFVWRSFLQIFMLQGAVVLVVALPVLIIINHPGQALGILDLAGALVWLFGFTFEAVGDWQLLRFKNNPDKRGQVIQTGLWRFTRHPNYFGEATLWWGLFLIALGAPYGVLAILSPVLIGFLLLKVSGIPMLEVKYQGHPEFEAYKLRTNAFFPWFPKHG
jgi:steroid 5-alpha reductase family enzyme